MSSAAPPRTPTITRYVDWLAAERGLRFDPTTHAGYDAMWRWSCDDLAAFWGSLWDYFGVESPTPYETVLVAPTMPGACWFPGARLNYARHVLGHVDAAAAAGHPAIVFQNEALLAAGRVQTLAWPELRAQVASLAAELRRLGVAPGDRVVAFLPNIPQTIVAFLATASLGAIWSVCSPDMGPVAVLDRFRQIAPKVLIACDGYVHGGVAHDRLAVVAGVLAELPSVRDVVLVPNLDRAADGAALAAPGRAVHAWEALAAHTDTPFEPGWVSFDHPLWIVYSSGTTGLPKPIVHGHGGVLLEALKNSLHNDIGPSAGHGTGAAADGGDRYHWYSATGWIMWNSQLGALAGGTTVCIYDGNPGGSVRAPDWTTLWRFAAQTGVTFFGAGAAFYASCLKAGVEPAAVCDLSALRAIGSTGSPLATEAYHWIWAQMPKRDGRDIWLAPISGGTDFAGAFVCGLATLPVVAGEMQVRALGADVHAWSEPGPDGRGADLIDAVGELVCVRPMPSMPIGFWNDVPSVADADADVDADAVGVAASSGSGASDTFATTPGTFAAPGTATAPATPPVSEAAASPALAAIRIGRRYRDSYFDMYPGVWRHGDWIRITPRGGAVIYGRSDATINRHGIRMGTAELYRAVETLPEVLDSIVVDLEYLGRDSYMPLFVVLREGHVLDAALTKTLKASIRTALSARHVPNEIFQVDAVPRTLSGKKMELPLKKLLMGTPADQVFKLDAMANGASVAWFAAYAARRSTPPLAS